MTFEEKLREEHKAGKEEGLKEGREEGLKEGREEGLFESVIRFMDKKGLSLEEACDIIGLPIEKYRAYKKKDGAGE